MIGERERETQVYSQTGIQSDVLASVQFASAAILSPSGDCSISVHPDASGVTFQPPSSSDSEHVSTPSAAHIAGPSGTQRGVGEEAGPHRVRMCQLLML